MKFMPASKETPSSCMSTARLPTTYAAHAVEASRASRRRSSARGRAGRRAAQLVESELEERRAAGGRAEGEHAHTARIGLHLQRYKARFRNRHLQHAHRCSRQCRP